ncbi:MAG: hypothetical protein DRQ48_12050 [Gammaproteobacteria bacterium]|nr:MAG: hypothetical protein DRQ48_12050 [Gammaproteobacteria bacterium]
MDANLNGALAMVSSSGSPKSCVGSRHSGALFLRTFFLGMQKEGTRHKDETNNKKALDSRMRGNDGCRLDTGSKPAQHPPVLHMEIKYLSLG